MTKMNFKNRHLKDIKAENPLFERVFADRTGLNKLYVFWFVFTALHAGQAF
jgi:hypothetical protein